MSIQPLPTTINLLDLMGIATPETTVWQDLALCAEVGDDLWFPEKGGTTRPAKDICRRCEVRVECLTYAQDHDVRYGIWGGLSERERRKLRRRPAPTVIDQPTHMCAIDCNQCAHHNQGTDLAA